MKDLNKTKELLKELVVKANQAILAIENNKPNNEICDLAIADIDELTDQISSAFFGDYPSVINKDINVEV